MSILHNTYKVEVHDALTHRLKQVAYAKNVVLNQFYSTHYSYKSYGILLGQGSGTPASTDTGLFSLKTTIRPLTARSTRITDNTRQYTVTGTTALSDTGVYTEIGLAHTSSGVTTAATVVRPVTHAMLTDAEGSPITITETDTDYLTVTVTFYVTYSVSDTLLTYSPYLCSYAVDNKPGSLTPTIKTSLLFTKFCEIPATSKIAYASRYAMPVAYLPAVTWSVDPPVNSTLRAPTTEGNLGFYNYALMTRYTSGLIYDAIPIGYLQFPNEAVMPRYRVPNLSVGIGDGTTTDFKVPIDFFIKDSDVLYVNGTALVRGVDYTIEHNSNPNRTTEVTVSATAEYTNGNTPSLGYFFDATSGNYDGYTCMYSLFTDYRCAHQTTISNVLSTCSAVRASIRSDLPLKMDLGQDSPFGREVNYIKLPRACIGIIQEDGSVYCNPTLVAQYPYFTGYLRIEVSNTDSNYTVLQDVQYINGIPESVNLTSTVSYRYWRFTPYLQDNTPATIVFCWYTKQGSGWVVPDSDASHSFFGYTSEHGIHFIEPPAADAVIELSVMLDRPYKTEDFVLDIVNNYTEQNS